MDGLVSRRRFIRTNPARHRGINRAKPNNRKELEIMKTSSELIIEILDPGLTPAACEIYTLFQTYQTRMTKVMMQPSLITPRFITETKILIEKINTKLS